MTISEFYGHRYSKRYLFKDKSIRIICALHLTALGLHVSLAQYSVFLPANILELEEVVYKQESEISIVRYMFSLELPRRRFYRPLVAGISKQPFVLYRAIFMHTKKEVAAIGISEDALFFDRF
ncbi:hypothetical protein CU097_014841 [Rhizopus azygosporus]|uniref:Uncharacterized protein n=1 Tax=Rhizopus azygosporus TaxID=86630 RepID=A0A367K3V8_RHIAZ|nr:hypothetical protein CU097_014841 [Rhizopus azygosporus]